MNIRVEEPDPGDYRGPIFPPQRPPPISERLLIERPADLVAMAQKLDESPRLAIDVEFVSARDAHQPPRLALIQIADGAHPTCYVVDALRLMDLSPLVAPFENPASVKIFHGVGSDVRVLAARGVTVAHTLDIEAVSRTIFGSRESGLQAMLTRACGIRLDKTLQRSDWTQRPLTTAMFAYAARDAEMTLALAHWLNEHYRWAMDLYEDYPDDPQPATLVAPWLANFIQGDRTFPPDLAEEAEQRALAQDCIAALTTLKKPTWRARVLRAAADLALMAVAPLAIESLRARTGEERAAAARALGRLRAAAAQEALTVALGDVNFDVRRAAGAALEQLALPPRVGRFARTDTPEVDVAAPDVSDVDTPWKAQLRGFLPEDGEV
jgi:hypothetical protein